MVLDGAVTRAVHGDRGSVKGLATWICISCKNYTTSWARRFICCESGLVEGTCNQTMARRAAITIPQHGWLL